MENMLGTIGDIAGIVAGLSVLVAVIFGIVQVYQLRQQRRDSAAIELMRAFQTPRFVESFQRLSNVPENTSAADLRAMSAEYEEAAISIVNVYETVGLLVFRRTVSFRAVYDACGGMLAEHWKKLHVWVEDTRREQDYERFGEWFQWLVERAGEQQASFPSEPAYKRFRGWRPGD